MATIFISYSRHDVAAVRALAADVQMLGHRSWLDEHLIGGQRWWDEILREIRTCDVFLFALSKHSLGSTACVRELEYAIALRRSILPVVVEPIFASALPPVLTQLQLVDFSSDSRESALRLARALVGMPPPAVVEEPLPPAPEFPVSSLRAVRDRLEDARALTREEEAALVQQLKVSLVDVQMADDARSLLHQLKSRCDSRSTIRELDRILAAPRKKMSPRTRRLRNGALLVVFGGFGWWIVSSYRDAERWAHGLNEMGDLGRVMSDFNRQQQREIDRLTDGGRSP